MNDNIPKIDTSSLENLKSLISSKGANWFDMIKSNPEAFHALRSDTRFSYTLHIPKDFYHNPDDYKLIVAVHGTSRCALKYRDEFSNFSDKNKFVVLAPLFPVGVNGDGYSDGYKNLIEKEIRYDLILIDMVKEISEALAFDFDKFYLFGFSGGAQFAHRFFYLHPDKLTAVSIGAPGLVTKLDDNKDWLFGVKDVKDKFGVAVNLSEIRRVKVQIVVGGNDVDDLGIPDKYKVVFEKFVGKFGGNRLENMYILNDHYLENGLTTNFVVVKGVSHDGLKLLPDVKKFFFTVRAEI